MSAAASSEPDLASEPPAVNPALPCSQEGDLAKQDVHDDQQSSGTYSSSESEAPSTPTGEMSNSIGARSSPNGTMSSPSARTTDDSIAAPSLRVDASSSDQQLSEIPLCEEKDNQTAAGNDKADMEGLTPMSILDAVQFGSYCDLVAAFEQEFAKSDEMQLPVDLVAHVVLRQKQEWHESEDHHHQDILQICKFLTSRTSIPFDVPDAEQRTPLFHAASSGSADLVSHLLEFRAEVNTVDIKGETPLLSAAGYGRAENVRLLIGYRADVSHVNCKSETALHLAAAGCHFQSMLNLLEAMSSHHIHAVDENCQTALLKVGNGQCCELLLDHDVDPNLQDIRGQNAMFAAARCGCLDMCRLLVERGCDIHVADANGNTALFEALISNHRAVCEFLVDVMFSSIIENKQCESMCSRLLACQAHAAARQQAQELGFVELACTIGLLEEMCSAKLSKEKTVRRKKSSVKDDPCQSEEAGGQLERCEDMEKGSTDEASAKAEKPKRPRSVSRASRRKRDEQHQAVRTAKADLARQTRDEEHRKVEADLERLASLEETARKEARRKRSKEEIPGKLSAASGSAVASHDIESNRESLERLRSRRRSHRSRKRSRSRRSTTPSPVRPDDIEWYVLRVEDLTAPPGQVFLPMGCIEELERVRHVQAELAASVSKNDVVLARYLTLRNRSNSARALEQFADPPHRAPSASLSCFQKGSRRSKPRPSWKRGVLDRSRTSSAAPVTVQSEQDCSHGQEGRDEDALSVTSSAGSLSPKRVRRAKKHEEQQCRQSKAARAKVSPVHRGAKTMIDITAEERKKIDTAAEIEEVAEASTPTKAKAGRREQPEDHEEHIPDQAEEDVQGHAQEQDEESSAQSSGGSPYTGEGDTLCV